MFTDTTIVKCSPFCHAVPVADNASLGLRDQCLLDSLYSKVRVGSGYKYRDSKPVLVSCSRAHPSHIQLAKSSNCLHHG